MKWMPINTAPKDGELILVCRAGKEAFPSYNCVYYSEMDGEDRHTPNHPWHFAEGMHAYHKDWPTHWAKLRPPPIVLRLKRESKLQ